MGKKKNTIANSVIQSGKEVIKVNRILIHNIEQKNIKN
jgi:hypothetical protein